MSNIKPHPTFSAMVAGLAKPGTDILASLTPESCHILHMTMGMVGEIGEVEEAFYMDFSEEKKIEELGDLEFYLEGLRQGIPNYICFPSGVFNTSDTGVGTEHLLVTLSITGANIADIIKKAVIYEKPINKQNLFKSMQVLDEILDILMRKHNIRYKDVIAKNMEKLGKRYPGFEYSNKSASDRVDTEAS